MVDEKVEALRKLLNSKVETGTLTSQDILEASRKLDTMIVEYCKSTLKKQENPPQT